MIALALSTFGLIFLAELPDKTSLAALVLATKYRARDVIAGAWLAFVVQTVIAVAAGSLLQFLPARPVHVASGVGFLIFAALAFRRNEAEELAEESAETSKQASRRRTAWLASFLVVFAAEWGDLTQLATAALVARTGKPLPVAVGAIAALWAVTIVAVVTGSQLGRWLTADVLRRASGVVFLAVGIFIIVAALR